MEEIPAYKVIIAGTIIFVTGLAIFSVIFRASIIFNEIQTTLTQQSNYTFDQTTMLVFATVPWALGAFYASLIGVVIYFVLKGGKKARLPPIY